MCSKFQSSCGPYLAWKKFKIEKYVEDKDKKIKCIC